MATHDIARFHKWIHRKPHLFEYANRLLVVKDAKEHGHDLAWAKHYLGMRVGLRPQEIEPALKEYRRMAKADELARHFPKKQKSAEEHRTEAKVDKSCMVEGREVEWDPKKGWIYLDNGRKVGKKIAPPPPERMPK